MYLGMRNYSQWNINLKHCWLWLELLTTLDLGVTWYFEIQLTWNFFNSLSNLVGILFFQLTSKFCDSLFDLGVNDKIVLSHSKRKQEHAIAIMTPSITT